MLKNSLKITQPTYQIGLNEIHNLCEFYGESRKYGAKYTQPIINSQELKNQWPFFKLMLLDNFQDVIGDLFRYYTEDFKDVLDIMKIILLIPSNSACCERGNFK